MKSKLVKFALIVFLFVFVSACGAAKPSPTLQPTSTLPPADATITFSGGICAYAGADQVSPGKMTVDIVVTEKDRNKYGLVALTLQEGKTFTDIEQWFFVDPPPWINIIGYAETPPDSRTRLTVQVTDQSVIFACFYSPPDKKIGTLGPVAVEGAVAAQPPLPTITPHAAPPVPTNPKPVIIDTDMGADDWMALLYLLQRPELSIQAITVSGTGLAHCEPGIRNAQGLVALAGHAALPIACGRETPLAGNHAFPEAWRTAADTLRGTGIELPEGQNTASGETAVELLSAAIKASPSKVTLLALGPLTNLAELFQAAPAVKDKIEMVTIMGGAVHVPGNLSPEYGNNLAAESNIFMDPKAANIVFASGVPLTLVPLDATNQVPVTPAFYRQLEASQLTPEARWLYTLFTKEQSYFQNSFYFFWDPLAAALLTDDSLATYEQATICVEETEGSTSGHTAIQAGCPELRVAVTADALRFEQVFLDTLNNP